MFFRNRMSYLLKFSRDRRRQLKNRFNFFTPVRLNVSISTNEILKNMPAMTKKLSQFNIFFALPF